MSATHQSELERADPITETRDAPRAWAVFGTALSIRLTLASVFLGGIDISYSIGAMPTAMQHGYIKIPYFPLVANWLGLAGVLDGHWIGLARTLSLHPTFVPLGLFPKLLPCLADSLLAAWFALDLRHSPRYRSLSAWAYATCPLPLVIICLQGQWDSIWILFTLTPLAVMTLRDPTVVSRILSGALFAFGVLLKPTPIVLFPFLLEKYRQRLSLSNWVRRMRPIVLAFLATVAGAFSWFGLEGFDLSKNLRVVLSYSTTGLTAVAFGLSRLSTLNHFGDSTGFLRDASIALAFALVVRYHLTRHRTDPIATAAAVLLILPAVGGLDGQYLLWALPFMIAAGRLRLSIIYGSLSAFIVLAYCAFPGLWYSPSEESNFFLPIRSLRFLAIPGGARHWLASTTPPALWRPVSNLIVPIVMLALAIVLLRSRSNTTTPHAVDGRVLLRRAVVLNLAVVIVLVVAAIVYQLGPYPKDATRVLKHFNAQLHGYALSGLPFAPRVQSGSWWGTVVVLFPVAIVAWSLIIWRRCRAPEASSWRTVT